MHFKLKKFLEKIKQYYNIVLEWLAVLPKCSKDFLYENLGISVCFHLLIIACMITSFVVSDRIIVAPARMEVIDIDLSRIKITKDKTNVSGKNKPISTKQEKGHSEKPVKNNVKNNNEENLVMTVNRSSSPLMRNMTVSVTDALRIAMSRCWRIDSSLQSIQNIKIVAHISMNPNGYIAKVWYDEESRAYQDKLFAKVLQSVKSAINVCQPFSMLPPEMYSEWKDIELNFYPSTGIVQ